MIKNLDSDSEFVSFRCNHCSVLLKSHNINIGKKLKCSECENDLVIPQKSSDEDTIDILVGLIRKTKTEEIGQGNSSQKN